MDKCPKKNTGNKDNSLNKESRRVPDRSSSPQWQASCAAVEKRKRGKKERAKEKKTRTETLHTTYLMNVRIRESMSATN